jgi:hypothetical protein
MAGGVGVCGALGTAFVVLKLCGVVDWSWWWVLAPLWAPPAAALAAAAGNAWARIMPVAERVPASPWPGYEPVHGWTTSQLRDYLARNPAYRQPYEAEVQRRSPTHRGSA